MTPAFAAWPQLAAGRLKAAERLAGAEPVDATVAAIDPVVVDEGDGVAAALFIRTDGRPPEAHVVVFEAEADHHRWHPDFDHVDAWIGGPRPATGGLVLSTSQTVMATAGGRLVGCLAGVVAQDVAELAVATATGRRGVRIDEETGAFAVAAAPPFDVVAVDAGGAVTESVTVALPPG